MTTRPGPRKSTLAGKSPTAPSQPTVEEPVTIEQPAAEQPAEQKSTPKKRPKVSFYQDEDDTRRARAAWAYSQTGEGWRTWSEFLQRAVMAETERLEAKYNGGAEWEGIGAREVPQGRPVGS